MYLRICIQSNRSFPGFLHQSTRSRSHDSTSRADCRAHSDTATVCRHPAASRQHIQSIGTQFRNGKRRTEEGKKAPDASHRNKRHQRRATHHLFNEQSHLLLVERHDKFAREDSALARLHHAVQPAYETREWGDTRPRRSGRVPPKII